MLSIVAVCAIFSYTLVFAKRLPKQFSFKEEKALSEWEEKIFKGRVLYVVEDGKLGRYLSAYSKESASGIFYKIKFDPKKEPMVSWKWKVVKFPEKKSMRSESDWIEKDDYAARFYVIFPRLAFNLTKSLEYVWDEDIPEGTVMTSPYFKNIKIIVIESGKKNLGKWVSEERNVYEDYKLAFGRNPGEAGAIAIMTDTDNSLSTAEAHYDEVKVGYKDGE
ncbi:MAG: DUF3047 domain-containing protein [Candidatus Omnitrophica bacterium]|nr:DUF3047 domain-containing protein [Candidatus Omnitrophota bacterium]